MSLHHELTEQTLKKIMNFNLQSAGVSENAEELNDPSEAHCVGIEVIPLTAYSEYRLLKPGRIIWINVVGFIFII